MREVFGGENDAKRMKRKRKRGGKEKENDNEKEMKAPVNESVLRNEMKAKGKVKFRLV